MPQDCVKRGIETEVTAVTRPDVDVERVRILASSLGASFRPRSYYN